MDMLERIEELINKIENLNYHYYTLDEPLVADEEYDKLYDELIKIEKETGIIKSYSPTQRVGGEIVTSFEKHTHLGRLWSLDKAQTDGELIDWDTRVKKLINEYNAQNEDKLPEPEYVLEYKFDGLTINLTYDQGALVGAATRGNGVVGENILPQIKKVKNIPLKIHSKLRFEVQGEGIMPISKLHEYNETHDEKLKNARNAAAGALRNLDTSIINERGILVYTYNIGYIEDGQFSKHTDIIDFLKENKFPVYQFLSVFTDINDMLEEIKNQGEKRKSADVLTDGMVIKINDLKTREVLGYTNKFPRWAIAYKYKSEIMTTVLKEVVWNIGRTSKVTPSAILEPVEIGGATVTRATLNNYDDIVRKGLKINSTVRIRRSNEVIPEILGVVEDGRDVTPIEVPEYCPSCGTELVKNGVHLFCPNSLSCKPQLISRIVHFASRNAMNIEGLSEKTAELFIDNLDIKTLPDLYRIRYEDLIVLESFKKKKSENMIKALEQSKNPNLSSFVYALGIDNVGIKTAESLAEHFENFENIRKAKIDELTVIEDIGDVVALSIVEFMNEEHISEALDELFERGVEPRTAIKNASGKLENLTFVITGTFENHSRTDLEKLIKSQGGKAGSSVSKKTDYLVLGESPGSKYDKALELNTKVIGLDELMELIDGSGVSG